MGFEIGQANRLGNRNSNQDRFAVVETDQGVLLVLADGMGGKAGGELAAELLIKHAQEAFLRINKPVNNPAGFFGEVIRTSHQAILAMAEERDLTAAPGTTGVLCLVQEGTAQWAHVGDSRLYIFRADIPLYRTRDHSYVESLYERGDINFSDKASHPMRNHITQCIGCLPEQPQADMSKPTRLHNGDIILLCSDGFWGPLEDLQIGAMLKEGELETALDRIAEKAEHLSYPQSDNISAVALRYSAIECTRSDTGTAPVRSDGANEPLLTAIEEIEEAIRRYEEEMKR